MRNPQVYASEDGYSIRGIEPADLQRFPDDVRKMFWGWVVEIGLQQKDRDLSKGLDKDGNKLRAILPYTRKHRRSAMTPSGKGAPEAPPLSPGYQKSRVRSLLTGKAFEDHAEFWWKFDPYTRDSFARVLEYQAEEGRDVFGLSPAALRRTRLLALERYDNWKRGKKEKPEEPEEETEEEEISTDHSDESKHDKMNKRADTTGNVGWMTEEELRKELRKTAKVRIPGRPRNPKSPSPAVGPDYNKMLRDLWKKMK